MATFAEDMECIRNECRRELLEEVMPFWNQHGVDAEHGGFICGLGHAGNVVDDSKFAWYQGRGVWAAMPTFRNIEKQSVWAIKFSTLKRNCQ